MKLSPEAKQAVKTAIEQLRLLLVDDAMDTVREAASKHWMDAGKEFVTPVIKSASISNGGQSAGLIQAEKRPHYEAQEVEKVISDIMRIAASSELLRQLQAEKRPDNEARKVIVRGDVKFYTPATD
ncbi:hypothetical protein AAA67_002912 [Salmonella enterica subsp. diarizonae]|nr:hypothetical protein [Salmonella enterica subsp. diarizonae]